MGGIKTIMVYRDDLEVKINESDFDFWKESGWSTDKPEAESDYSKMKKDDLIAECVKAVEAGTLEDADFTSLKKNDLIALLAKEG